MDGGEREEVCFILPHRSEFDLWNYCVCFSHSCVQLLTSSETTLEQRCPLEGHQLCSTHIPQLQQRRKAKVPEQNSGFCSGFSPSDLPAVPADKSALGTCRELLFAQWKLGHCSQCKARSFLSQFRSHHSLCCPLRLF